MRGDGTNLPEEPKLFSSLFAASRTQKTLALCLVLALVFTYFLVSGPLSGVPLGQSTWFVPAYVAAMFVNNSITAVLLFAHYSILRSPALLVIASGYVFTALISIPWVMALAGGLAPTNLIGGVQSPAWLYISWHGGFALFVAGYALLNDEDSSKRYWKGVPHAAIASSITLTLALVLAVSFFCVAAKEQLPVVNQDPVHFNSRWLYFIGALQ